MRSSNAKFRGDAKYVVGKFHPDLDQVLGLLAPIMVRLHGRTERVLHFTNKFERLIKGFDQIGHMLGVGGDLEDELNHELPGGFLTGIGIKQWIEDICGVLHNLVGDALPLVHLPGLVARMNFQVAHLIVVAHHAFGKFTVSVEVGLLNHD